MHAPSLSHSARSQLAPGFGNAPRRGVRTILAAVLLACIASLAIGSTAQAAVSPAAGSFTGRDNQNGYPFSFYVATTGKQVQDISIPVVNLACSPGATAPTHHITIATASVNLEGRFSANATRKGVYAGAPATFKYSFAGQLQGGNPASGTYREEIAYSNGTAVKCTSGVQPWTATRDSQPAQTASPAPSGSFTGKDNQNGYEFGFYVAADSKSLQDVSIRVVNLDCAPGNGAPEDHITIPSIPVTGATTFTAVVTKPGVIDSYPATYTYTFSGHFHGLNNTPAERAAGNYREEVTYNNGSSVVTCTSNDQSWSATRDLQPAQTSEPPPPGSYTGHENQNGYPFSFYVAGSGTSVQDISIPVVNLACAPSGGAPADHITLSSVPLENGSFSGQVTRSGVVAGGYTATYTYTFAGHFHGLNNTPAERAAGNYREEVTYNNGSATVTCTSNDQSWSATRDSQPTQTTTPPPDGGYTGHDNQNGYSFSFAVSGSGTTLEQLTIPVVNLACAPGAAAPADHISLGPIAIEPDGSFSAGSSVSSTYAGHPATYTYTFNGHFHGLDKTPSERGAGTYREEITYTNGSSTVTCTSNDQSWAATHA